MSKTEETPLGIELPSTLHDILMNTPELAQARLVGGCVRDALLGTPSKDIDVEVFGVTYETLIQALDRHGATDLVGRSFGVVKLTLPDGMVVDFSVPRRDSHVGPGHQGFVVEVDPSLSPRDAAARRDFTINALSWDPRRRVVVDHFGGLRDLEARVLRHTSDAFGEDPLRVLRGMQFAARFGMTAAPETLEICRSIKDTYHDLSIERVREEWFKWATKGHHPSHGLRFLRDSGWLEHFPELAAMVGVEQDPQWHPEGDVWAHTLFCLDALVELPEWEGADEERRIVWAFAVLLHDVGKPTTTDRVRDDEGRMRIVSPGHDQAGGPLAVDFMKRIGSPSAFPPRVEVLVVEHMAHLQAQSSTAVRRLSNRLGPESIHSLGVVIRADHFGRPPLPREVPEKLVAMIERAEALAVASSAPKRLLEGRHLMELGWTQGRVIGVAIRAAYEAQLAGEFDDLDGAMRWIGNHPELGPPPPN